MSADPARAIPRTAPQFWREPLAELLARLAAGEHGLSQLEAARRLVLEGENLLRPRKATFWLIDLLRRFRDPLILVLLCASLVSAFTGEVASVSVIAVVVSLSIAIDFVQERRSARAVDGLRALVETRATVLRDSARRELPTRLLVPGDVVQLSAGDLVPADCRLLSATDLFVNQAALTGEPFPVEKTVGEGKGGGVDEATNAVFVGSAVVSGTGSALVCRTGAQTELGQTSRALEARPPPTEAELGAARFGRMVLRVTAGLVLFVLVASALQKRPFLESLLFAVALAVGLTPELLPMIVSVTQARGALRLARRDVIVKHPPALQNLGSIDVLCTDKTGTLTEACIRLERHVDPTGLESDRTLELAYLNSWFETGLRSPLDQAILQHSEVEVGGFTKIDEVPFDFERRRVSVLLEQGPRRLLVVKGAPEDVLRLSTSEEVGGATAALDAPARARSNEVFERLGLEGFRVLGVAWKEVERTRAHASVHDEEGLVFAGFAAFLDPPKKSAAQALQRLEAVGVKVKVLTGDNERVTQHVCRELGLTGVGTINGVELDGLDQPALLARVDELTLFCRMNPRQKHRVLLALKERGHVVGYLGDGVNDAPALHAADVGISVDSAVDVAKEAAELILLKHDLNVLLEAISEGRRTHVNVMKYVMMGASSAFGNMLSMAGASAFLPFLPMLPVQVLLNNLLYDVSEIAIPFDEVDAEAVALPRRWDTRFVRTFMLTVGPVSSLFDLLTFFLLLNVFHASEVEFHTGWFLESMATQVLVIFVIRTRLNPLRSRPHPALAASSLGIVALSLSLPFTPLGPIIGFQPLAPFFYGALALIVGAYLVLVQLVKAAFFRRLAHLITIGLSAE